MPEPITPQLAADRVIICRPGRAAQFRAWLDERGDYGVAVTESPYLPDGTEAMECNLASLRESAGLLGMFDDVIAREAP
jgi:hypothetical protein